MMFVLHHNFPYDKFKHMCVRYIYKYICIYVLNVVCICIYTHLIVISVG